MKIYLEKDTKTEKTLKQALKWVGLSFAGYVLAYSFKDIVRYVRILRM